MKTKAFQVYYCNRHGETGTVKLVWNGEFTLFRNLEADVKNKVIKAEILICLIREKVLVGLSGSDSVALLLVLSELGYKVSACHINHQLRGEESDRDESFCIKLCNSLNIELFVEKLDVNTYCKENKRHERVLGN